MSASAPSGLWTPEGASMLATGAGGVPRAQYKVEIGWGQTTGNLFTFGTSKFGGTDLLAASSWSAGFTGPYNDLTTRNRTIAITRGRDNDLTTMRAGQVQLGFRDADGLLNPQNSASPLAAYLETDVPVRVSAIYAGVTYPLYYGFVTDIEADPSLRGMCQITAVDFLDKLDRQSPVVNTLVGPQTDGQIIGAILDWFRWTDPTLRNIGTGDSITETYARAAGSTTGLALVSELLDAERGLVYVAAGGAVTYIDRKTRYAASSVATIDRKMTAFPVGKSNSNIVNQWTVQRTDMAGNNVGVAQVWPDPATGLTASQQKHGTIAQTLTTPFLNSDTQALNLAQYMILRTAGGLGLVYDIPITIPDAATLIQVLSRDIGDRVTLTVAPRTMASFTADFNIESISHTISATPGPRHVCVWRVSAVPTGAPFRFGSSKFGGTDALYY